VSNADGIAAFFGWALGSEGQQTLSAEIADAAPVVFMASISTDACNSLSPLSNGSSPLLLLSLLPCTMPDGRLANSYSYRVNDSGAYSFEAMSSNFDAVLSLTTKDGRPVAEANATYLRNASFNVFLTRGDYIVTVTSTSASESGAYRLVVNGASGDVSECIDMFITVGTTTSQTLAKGDCELARGYYFDRYRIYVTAGTRVSVTMGSNVVDNMIEVSDLAGSPLSTTHEYVPYDGRAASRVSFTARTSGYHVIKVYMDYDNGPYTLWVN
jgi:hypothetical protein